jgi:hypothetical protein
MRTTTYPVATVTRADLARVSGGGGCLKDGLLGALGFGLTGGLAGESADIAMASSHPGQNLAARWGGIAAVSGAVIGCGIGSLHGGPTPQKD